MAASNLKITNGPDASVEVEGELSVADLESYKEKVLARWNLNLEIPGFRKGHTPKQVIIAKVGEMALLEETVENALKDLVPKIFAENKLDIIGRPEVLITKIAPGSPVSFKIKALLFPKIGLPDYQAIAKTEMAKPKEETSISDDEVENAVKQIQKSRGDMNKKAAATDEQKPAGEKAGTLPPLTDDFVKTLGGFSSVADFKNKIREHLKLEKELRAKDKKRIAISEKIMAGTKVVIPKVMTDGETNRLLARFRQDVEASGKTFESYLKQINKTEEELKNEFRPEGERRAKLQLVLNQIAINENLKPDETAVQNEVKHLLEHYRDANLEQTRMYVETVLTNEKVFEFLETQK